MACVVKISFVEDDVLYHILDDKSVITTGINGVIEYVCTAKRFWDCTTDREDWYIRIPDREEIHLVAYNR